MVMLALRSMSSPSSLECSLESEIRGSEATLSARLSPRLTFGGAGAERAGSEGGAPGTEVDRVDVVGVAVGSLAMLVTTPGRLGTEGTIMVRPRVGWMTVGGEVPSSLPLGSMCGFWRTGMLGAEAVLETVSADIDEMGRRCGKELSRGLVAWPATAAAAARRSCNVRPSACRWLRAGTGRASSEGT